jgi:hypothetical protein
MKAKLDMLACSKTEIWFVFRELEGIRACVVREWFAINELDRDPSVLLQYDLARVVR